MDDDRIRRLEQDIKHEYIPAVIALALCEVARRQVAKLRERLDNVG